MRYLEEAATDAESGSRALLSLCRLARAYKAAGRADDAEECAGRAEAALGVQEISPEYGPEIYYSLGTVYDAEETADKGKGYLARANELLGARTRSIRSIVHREHYLTMTWPNREILEEARRLTQA